MRKGLPAWMIAVIPVLIVAFDQATKLAVLAYLDEGEVVPVLPGFFNIVLVFNKGVAFGMFSGLEDPTRLVLLSVLKLAALSLVVYFLFWEFAGEKFPQACMCLILGGAIGNIIDRFTIGAVVDFLDFYVGSFHWHAFNVADSAISVGVTLLIGHQLLLWLRARGQQRTKEA